MDMVRLKELAAIKEKAKANKEIRKEFHDNWLQLIREEGLTEEVSDLLIAGVPYGGIEAFAEYLKTTPEMQKTVITFLHSAAFRKNSAIAFRCALNLLACLIRDVEMEFATCAVIMRELPGLAFTKKKQLITDIGKIFARQFYSVIYAKKQLPSLGYYALSDRDRKSFVMVFRQGLEQNLGADLNEREQMGAKLTAAWLESDAAEPVKKEDKPAVQVSSTVAAGTGTAVEAVVSTAKATNQQPSVPEKIPEESETWTGLYGKGLQNLQEAFKKAREELLMLSSEHGTYQSERETLQSELRQRKEETERLKEIVTDRDEELAVKDMEIKNLQTDIAWLKGELEKKEKEISDRIQMSEIAQKNSTLQSDQQLKRLGSALSTYYSDIMASEGVEMTAELGEILRDQIKDVFAVLMKNGISLSQ